LADEKLGAAADRPFIEMLVAAVGVWLLFSAPSLAESGCARVRLKAEVQIALGELTLADLLEPESCAEIVEAAAHLKLGAAPLAGSSRVMTGEELRSKLGGFLSDRRGEMWSIPERVVIERGGTARPCSEIAQAIMRALPGDFSGEILESDFDCTAARNVPARASLELAYSRWNRLLGRWEFRLRCRHSSDCVPFLLWARGIAPARLRAAAKDDGGIAGQSIRAGQTAILRWEEGGIRIVLPVTCLDGGDAGGTVRVRFKNSAKVLRAEILSDGTLRAGRGI